MTPNAAKILVDILNQIQDTILNIGFQTELFEIMAKVQAEGNKPDEAAALRVVITNLKDIQATYQNNITVLELAFGVSHESN